MKIDVDYHRAVIQHIREGIYAGSPAAEQSLVSFRLAQAELLLDAVEEIRLIRLQLHIDECERATIMIDELAGKLGIL